MTFSALFRKLGWAGCVASLFALVIMGASVQCGLTRATETQASHGQAVAHVGLLAQVKADHTHASADHAHDHAYPKPTGDGHFGDLCKDSCCGMGCHGAIGQFPTTVGLVEFPSMRLALTGEPSPVGFQSFRLDRPPRA